MPKGLPEAQDINDGKIKFFSLDTSTIQSAGYKFFNDKLLDLYLQLPYQMKIKLPDIIYKEIVSHKQKEIRSDLTSLNSLVNKLIRKEALMSAEFNISNDEIEARYIDKIKKEIDQYISQFDGEVLFTKNYDISALFDSYFNCIPPFENNNEKKHEFPDAVCLGLIENYSLEKNQIGIIISGDNGWKKFAEKSKNLYCARFIDEFTSLFSARSDEIANNILNKFVLEAEKINSYIREEIIDKIDYVNWIPNVYSENMYSCDAEINSYDIQNFSIVDYDIWRSERESATWVIKLNTIFEISLLLDVESFIKDWEDKELVSMGFTNIEVDITPNIQFHIICSNVEIDSECESWNIEIKLIDNFYHLDEIGVYHSLE